MLYITYMLLLVAIQVFVTQRYSSNNGTSPRQERHPPSLSGVIDIVGPSPWDCLPRFIWLYIQNRMLLQTRFFPTWSDFFHLYKDFIRDFQNPDSRNSKVVLMRIFVTIAPVVLFLFAASVAASDPNLDKRDGCIPAPQFCSSTLPCCDNSCLWLPFGLSVSVKCLLYSSMIAHRILNYEVLYLIIQIVWSFAFTPTVSLTSTVFRQMLMPCKQDGSVRKRGIYWLHSRARTEVLFK